MQWDVFCRVIDNFGDIGVCWRLALDLSGRGEQVRLWVDDPRALQWMAPQVRWVRDAALDAETGLGQPGVTVMHWADAMRPMAQWPQLGAGDVVVEAFGCDPPDAFVERMQARHALGQGTAALQWLNLEYLSAEDYVARCHGLQSPVMSGPGAGLVKRFFYPGFTAGTGGLLREPGLLPARLAGGQAQASRTLADLGISHRAEARRVMLFCYDSAPVGALMARLAAQAEPIDVLLAPGAATRQGLAWAGSHQAPRVRCHPLPYLPQDKFDELLWCTDLNLVRGEDSAVRALWAARPHIWQIYEQDDGVHAGKLQAFMDRWMAHWPPALRLPVSTWWLAFNGLGPMPDTLPDWGIASDWRHASEASSTDLRKQKDLGSQLITFVASSG